MVDLFLHKNVVCLRKTKNSHYFVSQFLVKYEEVIKTDYFNSRLEGRKMFKTVKERRNLYEEDQQFIYFPRGILEMIPSTEYRIIELDNNDKISVPSLSLEEIRKTLPTFDLRDDQVIAVMKGLTLKRGVFQLPTATGKTAIIASIIKRLLEYNPDIKILVISPTKSTAKGMNNTLVENGIDSKIFEGSRKDLSSPVTTSLVQSLVNQESNFLDGIDAVFYDECLPANSLVLLPDGSKKTISEVIDNDNITEVMSYNIEEDRYEAKEILRKFKTPFEDRFCKVYYLDPQDQSLKGVTCTRNHKIYVKDKGYVPAEQLSVGDLIKVDCVFARNWKSLTKYTYVPVKRVTFNVGRPAKYKYNIEVKDNHNYFANDVLVSNCHHLKCETWNRLNRMLPNVEYSLGFSALSIDKKEIFKTDFRDLSYGASLIVGSSGKVIMHMDPSYYIEKGIIALPVVLRVKHNELLPPNIDESDWHKVVKLGLMSTNRTYKISKIASMFSKYKRKVLILVSEKDYAFTICRFLASCGTKDFGVSFGAGSGFLPESINEICDPETGINQIEVEYKKEDSLKVLDMLNSGEISVLIATSHLDEGVDISKLDACILACGGKKDRRIVQRVGRVLRKTKTGKYAYVVDFTDSGSRVLSRQSKSRLSMYRKDIGVPDELIFNDIDINDVENKFLELERT